MKVRKAIKKIAALGAGLSMVGATFLGAMAADLSGYPSMFIKNGQFNGVIVVGDKAAAEDVVGSIDIATSLQYALGQPVAQATQPGGQGGYLSISGDAVSVSEPNDLLEIQERLGAVKETLTEFDLAGLQGGTIVTDEGSTDYNQYLRFEDTLNTSSTRYIHSGAVVFEEDEDDIVGDYLKFVDGHTLFEYELEFEEGAESEIDFKKGTSGPRELEDIEDEELNILGKVFSVVDSEIDITSQKVVLEMLGGDVLDTLEEGETRTYTIDGKEYEVTLIIVSDALVSAKFSVNGEITDELEDGETDVLRDGTEVGIRDILPNEAEEETGGDIVEFFLGANKVKLSDSNFTDDTFDVSGVEIHEEDIEDAKVQMTGKVSTRNETFELQTLKYRLQADSPRGDIYIAPGHGIREYLDEPEGMLSDDWDVRYEGLMDTGVSIIRFDANGDDSYDLQFTNREGLEYDIPFIDNSQDEYGFFKYGDEDDDLIFVEGHVNSTTIGLYLNLTTGSHTAASSGANHSLVNAASLTNSLIPGTDDCSNFFPIDEDDFFVLTNEGSSSRSAGDETSFTHILSYEAADVTNREITFQDQATGQREIVYSTTIPSITAAQNPCLRGFANTLVVGGNTFNVYIAGGLNSSGSNGLAKYPLAVDQNSDGDVAFDIVDVVVNGGGILRLGGLTQNATSSFVATNNFHTRMYGGVQQFNSSFGARATAQSATMLNNLQDYADHFRDISSGPNNGETLFQAVNGSSANVNFSTTLTTLASEFDGNGILDSGLNEVLFIHFFGKTNNEVDVDVPNVHQVNDTGGLTVDRINTTVLKMESLDEEDLEQGLSTYGVFFEQTDEDDTDDAEDLTIEYPLAQRGADVFITIGSTATTRVGPAAGGAVVVNPITVGSAKLASEVAGQETSQNIVAVGGPCINSVAATWMGSATPLCGAESGLSEGKAVIKLYEHANGNVGLLVAGWSAADTRRGTKVLAEYADYADKLVGKEVVVTGTSLSDITVSAPTP